MKKVLHILTLVIIGLAINNCKATLRGAYIHDSFTYTNVAKNRFLIGDVFFNDSLNFTGDSNRYARLLKEITIEEGYKVLPSALYKKKINQKYRKQIEENLKLGLGLDKKHFKALKRKLTQAKYLVFSVIDFEELTQSRRERVEADGETSGYISTSSRKMESSLRVYDIQQGILVYSGSSVSTKSKDTEYSIEEKEGLLSDIASLVRAAKGVKEETGPNVLYPYPEYPTRNSVLKEIFSIFAKSLPEGD